MVPTKQLYHIVLMTQKKKERKKDISKILPLEKLRRHLKAFT